MAREEKPYEIQFEQIERRTRVVTVYATSKTKAIEMVRDGVGFLNPRSSSPVVSRQNVKERKP